jgi:hypothetical protein
VCLVGVYVGLESPHISTDSTTHYIQCCTKNNTNQLVDYHVTRTLARAQWEILGFGPYASLPRERRMEVRACDAMLTCVSLPGLLMYIYAHPSMYSPNPNPNSHFR